MNQHPYFPAALCILFLISHSLLIGQKCLFSQPANSIAMPLPFIENEHETLHITVVIHLITEEGYTPISNQQVFDQLEALNRDFNKKNLEWKRLSLNDQATTGNAKIQFHLASKTPSGQPTNGITHTVTDVKAIGIKEALFFSDLGGKDPWPNNQFLNIWVCKMPDGLLGFASSPDKIGQREDGIVLNQSVFGITNAQSPYHLGRTLVHEVGHYLGLQHPWGSLGSSCEEDDGLEDTPLQKGPHYGCPLNESMLCDPSEVFYWNFMDFTADCCMASFTKDQVRLMRSVVKTQRASLIQAFPKMPPAVQEDIAISTYPNPAKNVFILKWNSFAVTHIIAYNMLGEQLILLPIPKGRTQIELCASTFPKGMILFYLYGTQNQTPYLFGKQKVIIQ